MPLYDPYCGPAPVPSELWTSWNLDPWLISGMLLSAAAYALAARASSTIGPREIICFTCGWLILAVLYVSPFCALTSALFSARVAHHVIAIAIAAPLIVLGCPLLARPSASCEKVDSAFRSNDALIQEGSIGSNPKSGFHFWVRCSRRTSNGHGVVFAVQMLTIWFWHAPAPYAAALGSHGVFWLMQASLLGTAILFWGTLPLRPAALPSLLPLLGNVAQMGLLGALITFAPAPLYEPHLGTTAAWHLSPLEDQQIAGLIMWIPAAVPYMLAALLIVGASLHGPSLPRGREGAA
ncbi:cytochrome c oxidase assembly protein [Microvirga sp. M2]|uniref:cytochrome c oxidase assembly protein n=1 Tax=Microvirga sp. M2 TaxID=3073270 RepID=UPI0039C3F7B2